MHRHGLLALAIALFSLLSMPTVSRAEAPLTWSGWSSTIFDKAKAENRFVLLDLEAVWCHWCHVMAATTYQDPRVVELIGARYLPVRVDQDANPDLSSRYGDWGWPATIVFAADGTEIVKLRGYRSPEQMASVLQAIIDDPSPGPSATQRPDAEPAASAFLGAERHKALEQTFAATYDTKEGGWGAGHKLIITDSLDYAMSRALAGDKASEAQVRETLDKAIQLIDPVWGGIYQYSEQGVWTKPHYEKIMYYQAQTLRQYSLAHAAFGEPRYRDAATAIYRYLTTFLRGPEGAFYVSQNADLSATVHGPEYYALDDAGRRKLGLPRIDTNLYARENGWAISGLAAYYAASADPTVLKDAVAAFDWVDRNRRRSDGSFAHGASDRGGPFLGDQIAMGQAAFDLYSVTGERRFLERARDLANIIGGRFRNEAAGFRTAIIDAAAVGAFAKPVIQLDENIAAARFLNLAGRTIGVDQFKAWAEHAMRYLAAEQFSEFRGLAAPLLLIDDELSVDPVHVTVVGGKSDPKAAILHQSARALPAVYKRTDWWDTAEGPMSNPDVQYPELPEAAAFACSNQICSEPVTDPAELAGVVERMMSVRVRRAAE